MTHGHSHFERIAGFPRPAVNSRLEQKDEKNRMSWVPHQSTPNPKHHR